MQGKILKTLMALIALAMVIAFLAPPVIKIRDPAMIIVVLIGVVAMIISLIEFVRAKDD